MSRSRKAPRKGIFRRPRTQRTRVMESRAVEEILEAGYQVGGRLQCRASTTGSIPTSHDDLYFSMYPRHTIKFRLRPRK
jgi:hypothetical protein